MIGLPSLLLTLLAVLAPAVHSADLDLLPVTTFRASGGSARLQLADAGVTVPARLAGADQTNRAVADRRSKRPPAARQLLVIAVFGLLIAVLLWCLDSGRTSWHTFARTSAGSFLLGILFLLLSSWVGPAEQAGEFCVGLGLLLAVVLGTYAAYRGLARLIGCFAPAIQRKPE